MVRLNNWLVECFETRIICGFFFSSSEDGVVGIGIVERFIFYFWEQWVVGGVPILFYK